MGNSIRMSQVEFDNLMEKRLAAGIGENGKPITKKEIRKSKAAKQEDGLQLECEAWLSKNEIWYKHDRVSKKERKGIPDLLISYKGYFVACELKSKTGKLKKEQAEQLAKIRRSRGRTFVARSLEEFIEKLKGGINERYPT